jgi:hypothetical protein
MAVPAVTHVLAPVEVADDHPKSFASTGSKFPNSTKSYTANVQEKKQIQVAIRTSRGVTFGTDGVCAVEVSIDVLL